MTTTSRSDSTRAVNKFKSYLARVNVQDRSNHHQQMCYTSHQPAVYMHVQKFKMEVYNSLKYIVYPSFVTSSVDVLDVCLEPFHFNHISLTRQAWRMMSTQIFTTFHTDTNYLILFRIPLYILDYPKFVLTSYNNTME